MRRIELLLLVLLAATACGQEPQVQQMPLFKCTELTMGLRYHGSAVVGTRLYVVGGATEQAKLFSDQVYSAAILPNSSLGEWRTERRMPEVRYYVMTSTEVVSNRIYVIGGNTLRTPESPESELVRAQDALWTIVQPDGTLGEWKHSEPFPGPSRSCAATASTDEHLFLAGGSSGQIYNDMYVCDFARDGAPTRWRSLGTLPVPLWFHGLTVMEDVMYLWGGLTTLNNQSINPKVYSAAVSADGSVGLWKEETPMPQPVYSSAFCGFNDYLVCVGGRFAGGATTTAIWYSHLSNKAVGPWSEVRTDLDASSYHALGLDKANGTIYITGGKSHAEGLAGGNVTVRTTQAFRLTQPDGRAAVSGSPLTAGGFASFETALAKTKSSGRKMLVLFWSPQVPACQRLLERTTPTGIWTKAADKHELAAVDITGSESNLCYKYTVFKVPCLAILNTDGTLVDKAMNLSDANGVKTFLDKKR